MASRQSSAPHRRTAGVTPSAAVGKLKMEATKSAKIEVLEKDGKTLLVLEWAGDIFFAADLHAAVLDVLQQGRDAAVCCEKLERLDTSAFQVLLALKKELGQSGRSLEWSGLAGAPADLAALAGLSGHLL
jgi:anti-anti-sigma regulatory factor